MGLWDDLIDISITYIANNDEQDIIVNQVVELPPDSGGKTRNLYRSVGYPRPARLSVRRRCLPEPERPLSSANRLEFGRSRVRPFARASSSRRL